MEKLPKVTNAVISNIASGSIAEELEIEPGDKLLLINGQPVPDQIAYRFLQADAYVELEIQKKNGELWILEIEKDMSEDLGLIFEDATFDGLKECRNKCIFCFVDQAPDDLRNSLYVKDDDYRHSFLFGNFITLTNVSEKDLQRIVDLNLSPLYVSVHTSNPVLRKEMLGNRHAGKIMDQLAFLTSHGIKIHAQIVLVPGINDGKELERTVNDLASLAPGIISVAVVPVGLTAFREGLAQLKTYNRDEARQVLDIIEQLQIKFLQQMGTRLVFVADEFFIIAESEIPEHSYYEDYPQLENGIGIIRLFLDEFSMLKKNLPGDVHTKRNLIIITGTSAFTIIQRMIDDLKQLYPSLKINVLALANTFYGPSVTVAGLLTGQDIIRGLNQLENKQDFQIVIPDIMLKDGTLFLDDLTISEVNKRIGCKLKPIPNTAQALIEAILDVKIANEEV